MKELRSSGSVKPLPSKSADEQLLGNWMARKKQVMKSERSSGLRKPS